MRSGSQRLGSVRSPPWVGWMPHSDTKHGTAGRPSLFWRVRGETILKLLARPEQLRCPCWTLPVGLVGTPAAAALCQRWVFYSGRREDLAFEKEHGSSADQRHHVRLWQVLDSGAEGRSVWLGSATFDK